MFDLNELTLPTPSRRSSHDWLCLSCRKVSLAHIKCVACSCKEFIPHLDRRPLLLSKEVQNGIVDLINIAADEVPQKDIEDQLYLTGEYMPFLSGLLDSAKLAEDRRTEFGSGFRTTDLSTADLLALFKDMLLPPSA